jgi:hypothetical protein
MITAPSRLCRRAGADVSLPVVGACRVVAREHEQVQPVTAQRGLRLKPISRGRGGDKSRTATAKLRAVNALRGEMECYVEL